MQKNIKMIIDKLSFFALILSSVLIANHAIAVDVSINITNPIATSDFSILLTNFLKWLLSVAGSLALLMLITGGVFYVTSSGNDQRVETAKKMITWTLLGLILILASYAIIITIDQLLTK
jgi:hypothetical protein